jgi:tRNA A-37 threonylcarbamoyl transferase component Bud32
MDKKYPKTLSSGANNTVIALSETEAGKLFFENTRSEIGSEAEKMKFANKINNLVVKFVRLDLLADDTEVLVMERLYPIDFRAFEFERRQLIFEVFEDELTQLHQNGFVHRDIRRPSDMPGFSFDNVFMTDQGIRLIDVGISALRNQVGDKLFDKFVTQEINELKAFETFFMNR